MSDAPWPPSFGAVVSGSSTVVRVWAPRARAVRLEHRPAGSAARVVDLAPDPPGCWTGEFDDLGAGDRYRLRANDGPWWPDPASRYQPEGPHGPSEVVDPSRFAWTDDGWTGPRLAGTVFYELHVGAFSPQGSFPGVRERLGYLRDLGVTAIELMPVAEFPGRWNWGYDGASLFAPSHRYGRPDDLRALVDAAHGMGLAVVLDVVYNHLGPDGAYLAAFAPNALTARHDSPWGAGLDLDASDGRLRQFFVDNAAHWVREYHVDGLRLDATHAIRERAPDQLLADVADAVRSVAPDRRTLVIAEDNRNLIRLVRTRASHGIGLDAVWSDDFHHEMRRHLAGDRDGYFCDFSGRTADIAATIARGWFFTGQHSAFAGGPRGTDPVATALSRFVICLQNHDQVGNRALGDRLTASIDDAAFAAASALLLLAPETPLLFMGQEWAAGTPFQFFTDHAGPLGAQVTEGRRQEFQTFEGFRDEQARLRIPDPQDPETFNRSRLDWSEPAQPRHAAVLTLHRELLVLRRRIARNGLVFVAARAVDDETVVLEYSAASPARALMVVARLAGTARLTVRPSEPTVDRAAAGDARLAWRVVLATRGPGLALRDAFPTVPSGADGLTFTFDGPAAIVVARGLSGAHEDEAS